MGYAIHRLAAVATGYRSYRRQTVGFNYASTKSRQTTNEIDFASLAAFG